MLTLLVLILFTILPLYTFVILFTLLTFFVFVDIVDTVDMFDIADTVEFVDTFLRIALVSKVHIAAAMPMARSLYNFTFHVLHLDQQFQQGFQAYNFEAR